MIRAINVNWLGDTKKRKSVLAKLGNKKTRLSYPNRHKTKKETLREMNHTWEGYNFGTINDTPHRIGGILILARKYMDMTPIETGQDTAKKGRVAWGIYETRGTKMLILGVYGPPGGDYPPNMQFFEDEVFSVMDKTTYDKVILVGDWNVYLDPKKDQTRYADPTRNRARTRELIKRQIRVHSLIKVYREQNEQKLEYTYLDKTGANKKSRTDYFLVDQEKAT